jgi:hypothetical protein
MISGLLSIELHTELLGRPLSWSAPWYGKCVTRSRSADSASVGTKGNLIKRNKLMRVKAILWYIQFTEDG